VFKILSYKKIGEKSQNPNKLMICLEISFGFLEALDG